MKKFVFSLLKCVLALSLLGLVSSCTQEQQNKISRSLQNWTGTNGVLDVFSEGKILYRIIYIDKISTADATSGRSVSRPYRFGFGVLDLNMNYIQDPGEKVTYFEFSDYSTPYLFYENPVSTSVKDPSSQTP